jgi:CDGSH-type Zn-finger protein
MASVTIRVKENGAYVVQGDVELVDHEGNVIPTTPGKSFSLCRCGGSTRKPFCDGTHSRIGFRGAQQAVAEVEKKEG